MTHVQFKSNVFKTISPFLLFISAFVLFNSKNVMASGHQDVPHMSFGLSDYGQPPKRSGRASPPNAFQSAYMNGLQFVHELANQSFNFSNTQQAFNASRSTADSTQLPSNPADKYAKNYREGLLFAQNEANRVNTFFQTYDPFGHWADERHQHPAPQDDFDKYFMEGIQFVQEQTARVRNMFEENLGTEDDATKQGYESETSKSNSAQSQDEYQDRFEHFEKQLNRDGLTINGVEFDVVDYQENTNGTRRRSLSLTSLYLYDKKVDAEREWQNAESAFEKWHASNRVDQLDGALAARKARKALQTAATDTTQFIKDHPGKSAWLAGENIPGIGVFMTGARNINEVHDGETPWYWGATDTALGFGGIITKGMKNSYKAVKTGLNVSKAGSSVNATRRAMEALDLAKHMPQPGIKLSKPGGVIRADAIPSGLNLEYLAPGRVRFDGVEFRAVRDLSHMTEAELKIMQARGVAPAGIDGKPMHGHHYQQLDHRDPDGFIVEIPRSKHNSANKVQHPKENGAGLPDSARKEWNESLRPAYWKERANSELLRRGKK